MRADPKTYGLRPWLWLLKPLSIRITPVSLIRCKHKSIRTKLDFKAFNCYDLRFDFYKVRTTQLSKKKNCIGPNDLYFKLRMVMRSRCSRGVIICLSALIFIIHHQEIIKVREWIPNIGPISKVIPLKLFLDIVPSSSADITRALRKCFRGEFIHVSFRFVSFQSKGKPPRLRGCLLWYFD